MPAGPIGPSWVEDSWEDTAWEEDAWGESDDGGGGGVGGGDDFSDVGRRGQRHPRTLNAD